VSPGQDKAILFNYHTTSRRKDLLSKVPLQGLNPAKRYRIKEINLFPETKATHPEHEKTYSGQYLMSVGMNVTPGRALPLTSNVFEITEVTD
jgi:alpha-galactosidase